MYFGTYDSVSVLVWQSYMVKIQLSNPFLLFLSLKYLALMMIIVQTTYKYQYKHRHSEEIPRLMLLFHETTGQ